MTDRDDDVARGYRALPRDEPPASIDAAILAASRRAVKARPTATRRWGPPLAAAAVLVLSVGVVLRMQLEQPDIATSMPAREEAVPPRAPSPPAQVAPAAEPATPTPQASADAMSAAPQARMAQKPIAQPEAKRARRSEPPLEPQPAAPPAPLETRPAPPPAAAFAPSAPAPVDASPPRAATSETRQDIALSPEATITAPVRAAPPPMAAAPSAARPTPLQDAKRESMLEKRSAGLAANTAGARADSEAATPEAALERIAKLRAEGRHADADRELERFRREHPGYRIPEAMWERVKPPAP